MSTPELAIEQRTTRAERAATPDIYRRIQRQIEEHPYRALAIAAGVGFVLGGGLSNRATSRLVATGLRVGLASAVGPLVGEFVERMRSTRARTAH